MLCRACHAPFWGTRWRSRHAPAGSTSLIVSSFVPLTCLRLSTAITGLSVKPPPDYGTPPGSRHATILSNAKIQTGQRHKNPAGYARLVACSNPQSLLLTHFSSNKSDNMLRRTIIFTVSLKAFFDSRYRIRGVCFLFSCSVKYDVVYNAAPYASSKTCGSMFAP